MQEEDFYKPIKEYFENEGFNVKAEINDCDCVCVKDDVIVICEFKLSFNISLVFQGMDRQKISDYVYLCIPRYKGRAGYRNFLKAKELVKKLGLGLIIVSLDSKYQTIDIAVEPTLNTDRKNKRKKDSLLKEYNGRNFDLNVGGQTRKKINTAFKEKCIMLLCILEKEEEISTREIMSKYKMDKSITGILYRNIFGFFIKTENYSSYKMSEKGKLELENSDNEKIVSFYREHIKNF